MNHQDKISFLKNMIASNNSHFNEIKIWEKLKQEAMNMNNGIEKNGAIKELNNQIEACKNENVFKFIDDKIISNILEIIYDSWLEHEDIYYSKIFKSIMNSTSFNEENISNGIASFDPYEIIGYGIIMQILNTNIMLQKLKAGRFVQSERDKKSRISTLEKSLTISHSCNNTNLSYELSQMIKQIKKEDYVTREIILKNCFFSIHKILSDDTSFFNDIKPLSKETYAKDITNSILSEFFHVKQHYKPSKRIAKKDFYEQNEKTPRTFYYYLSK